MTKFCKTVFALVTFWWFDEFSVKLLRFCYKIGDLTNFSVKSRKWHWLFSLGKWHWFLAISKFSLGKKINAKIWFHGKKSVCTKKFSPLVYLVNHVEICYCTTFWRDAMGLQHPTGFNSSQGKKGLFFSWNQCVFSYLSLNKFRK